MQLSQMADQKASILMGATFVVFTLAVGQARGVSNVLEVFLQDYPSEEAVGIMERAFGAGASAPYGCSGLGVDSVSCPVTG